MSKVSNWLISMAGNVIWTEVNWTEVHPYPRIRLHIKPKADYLFVVMLWKKSPYI